MGILNRATLEFHISRQARDHYQFNESLFSITGNVLFANFHAVRLFAQKMNARRDLVHFPEQSIRAGQVNAMGLIDEILHLVVSLYRQQLNPEVMKQALAYLDKNIGIEEVDQALHRFTDEFPPLPVYKREMSIDDYLEGKSTLTAGPDDKEILISNRQIALEEMLLLWLANANPAFAPFMELFDDTNLKMQTAYPDIMSGLHAFFDYQPPFGPENQNLIEMMRSPAIAVPHSLSGQLEYIRERWGFLLGRYLYRLLSSLDLIQEEERAIFLGPGPSHVYEFAGMEMEPERFSQDKDWMPSLVLIAKNSYVWLDQLSKRYQRHINRLDLIPDEELDQMARWGFTGLWLIGLWERSEASKRIKQLRGNPEAVASAYSLFDYQIADDLGGEDAYRNLQERAWRRGIRLASDMVPNHMGIDSRWVIEQPDWFISLPHSPFPSYSFNGPDLSWDERVGIFIEDHYYDSTDAAVVFRRTDNWTGDTRFIYHGNDGTSMPWNDTAQLNYLLPEVREAVIQTILNVARKFPIIRFDAAMTLAKKHYQRLWFPEPGTGGAIPSRAEYGLTKEQFDQAFPEEFWREVVDRVAQEIPDTLLLAEAFWLMEGYFVRTLGMHRVYNSAFMNMLRDEKNAEYRLVIKNTLEFDPEILKRYVNFMNNPDERTAVDQFGKGDKYFGVCVLMSTMPGLPMFGHGQIQGFTEKYGMEYRRAYWDESPDRHLIERHEREIFPILRKRRIFAEVRDFLLYDFYSPEGFVNEDVFAYSNRSESGERSLVVYHNRYATARGWIRNSAAYSQRSEDGERILTQKNLGEGLALTNESGRYCIFRDQVTGLEYIRPSQELFEKGLYVELDAYKYQVFLDFREIQDNEWGQYAQLTAYLNGRGVPNIEDAIKEIFLQPIHYPFRELVNEDFIRWVIDNRVTPDNSTEENVEQVLEKTEQKMHRLLREVHRLMQVEDSSEELAADTAHKMNIILHLPVLDRNYPGLNTPENQAALRYLLPDQEGDNLLLSGIRSGYPLVWSTLLGWLFTHQLGSVVEKEHFEEVSRSWIDEWLLGRILAGTFINIGLNKRLAWRQVLLIKLIIAHQTWWKSAQTGETRTTVETLQNWLMDAEVQTFLGVNRHQGVLWYNKESFDDLLWWMYVAAIINIIDSSDPESVVKQVVNCHSILEKMQQAEAKSGYMLERLVEKVQAGIEA